MEDAEAQHLMSQVVAAGLYYFGYKDSGLFLLDGTLDVEAFLILHLANRYGLDASIFSQIPEMELGDTSASPTRLASVGLDFGDTEKLLRVMGEIIGSWYPEVKEFYTPEKFQLIAKRFRLMERASDLTNDANSPNYLDFEMCPVEVILLLQLRCGLF